MFKYIHLENWRQFGDFRIEFSEGLTVITGRNGTGKTTLLRLLAAHFGWNPSMIGTPTYRNGALTFRTDVRRDYLTPSAEQYNSAVIVGQLGYASGLKTDITVSAISAEQYVP
jgi:predicted ATP-dependent endonuclease of OLD family